MIIDSEGRDIKLLIAYLKGTRWGGGWLVGWLVGWLGWLVGWLVG